ncbi:ABC transporter permease [Calothrix sp. UHCC 0171]|uniref:ABC transporter permease n=1 Tax=Calothrix sp. UHCC 0171 TaxID=3110245 RepID=UPI002B2019D7|nr:ABC transporter permease [Calothrix sp. UHCC 0171]MEA5572946.1 ABC transporter permease [Calothrix sp. UHCC 0171]
MMGSIFDKIGDWNPQFIREIKGRLKLFPVLVTAGISLLGQIVIFLIQLGQYPESKYPITAQYCLLGKDYQKQLNDLYKVGDKIQKQVYYFSSKANFDLEKLNAAKEQLKLTQAEQKRVNDVMYGGKFFCPIDKIDYQDWWRDHWEYIFLSLSVIFVFALLVGGTYLLINNLAQEERRSTLNFIRLSPQSETSILTGKILGVPILVYLFTTLAIPLHVVSGKAAGIAFSHIFSFYVILIGSCIFFFSAALLFTLSTKFLGGFQPWLGSGAVLVFLMFTLTLSSSRFYPNHGAIWFTMFSPIFAVEHLFPNLFGRSYYNSSYNSSLPFFANLQFFHIPVGSSLIGLVATHLANFGLWTYGIWQGLERRFRNPNTAIISKFQSYWLVAGLQVLLWGFTLQKSDNYYPPSYLGKHSYYELNYQITTNLPILLAFNLALLFGLMLILSPQRQVIQDWARYRHHGGSGRQGWQHSLFGDLLLGEKSPSLVAIAFNLIIMLVPVATWVLLAINLNSRQNNILDWLINDAGRFKVFVGLAMFFTIMMINATITQRMLILKTSKRYFWAVGTVGAVMFLPPIILTMINLTPQKNALPWLMSIFPWAGLQNASTAIVLTVFVFEVAILTGLIFLLTKKIQNEGASETKAMGN